MASPITLASLTAFEPVGSLTTLIHHLTSTPVHLTYFPYLRFPVMHAVRVAIIWAGLTRERERERRDARSSAVSAGASEPRGEARVGVLQDLFGYLCLAWGGSTLVALLQSTPPAWLISPTPWLIYPLVHLLFVRTGVAGLVGRIPLIDLVGAYIDGLTRGTTVAALSSPSQTQLGTSGRALLSIVGTCGGGWIVQSLSMHTTQWAVEVPGVLAPGAGILGTMDAWAAGIASLVYTLLLDPPASASSSASWFYGLQFKPATITPVHPDTARSVVVLLMAGLLAGRVITRYVLALRLDPDASTGKIKSKSRSKSKGGKDNGVGAGAQEVERILKELEAEAESETPKKKTGKKSSQSSKAATPQR